MKTITARYAFMNRLIHHRLTHLGLILTLMLAIAATLAARPTGVAAQGPIFINELLFDAPDTDGPNEYIELRGTPNITISNGVYLIGVEGDAGAANPGNIQTIFDLSGLQFGSNGFLVLLQGGNSYTPAPGANVLTSTTTSTTTGWSGFDFYSAESASSDIEDASVTFLLIESSMVTPTLTDDLDTDNDGTLDGSIPPAMTILDQVAILDGNPLDIGYAPIVFARNGEGGGTVMTGTTIIDTMTSTVGYVGRIGDSTGSTGDDWVGAFVTGMAPDFSLESGMTFPAGLGGTALDHLGATNPELPPVDINKIHTIQGDGLISPALNQTRTITGVVVGNFPELGDEDLNGFFVQEEDADADNDPLTSEGIFVLSTAAVSVGTTVQVTGVVIENFGMTTITDTLAVTEVNPAGPLPTAVTVDLPVTPATYLERYEGMRVVFTDTLAVTEHFLLGRFGEVTLAEGGRLYQPTQIASPGSAANAVQAANEARTIVLDDGSNERNPNPIIYPPPGLTADNTLRGGDTVANLQGVMHYSFGDYRVQPTGPVTFTAANPRPETPPDVGGSVKVASFNVLNYFTTLDDGPDICGPDNDQGCRGADTAPEFTRQRDKIVAAITALEADIVGLVELENNALDSLQNLVNGLNAVAGEGTYEFIDTGTIGTDAIKVGLIYQPQTVSPAGDFAVLTSTDFVNPNEKPEPKNRPALAQTFTVTDPLNPSFEEQLTVVVNHFKSKGASELDDPGNPCESDPPDDFDCAQGDGQGYWNFTRALAAQELAIWLDDDPTGSNDPDVLIIGDLNAYARELPIQALEIGGYTNLIRRFEGNEAYTFVFAGQWGYLDYALSNSSLTPQVAGAAIWSINADEPLALDYNDEDKPAGLYDPGPYRSSDHDPILVGLDLDDSIVYSIYLPAILKN